MIDFIIATTKLVLANWQRFLIGGIIVISAIIVFEGILKGLLIKKIKNKSLRKVVLAFLSLVLVFPATAFYFLADNISFDYYWYGYTVLSVFTVVGYWLYENTKLRDLFNIVGSKTLLKLRDILNVAFSGNNDQLKKELTSSYKDLAKTTKNLINKNNDLNKL